MSPVCCLLSFALRQALEVSVEQTLGAIEKRLTDHSDALRKALDTANDRAWQAVGLALIRDTWFGRIRNVFRDGDLKGVRDQIKQLVDQTPTGLEGVSASVRAKAAEEWSRLRKADRLSAATVLPAELARRVASMERYGDPGRVAVAARRAVADAADAIRADARHLADVLTAPPGGTPLLVAAFSFFFSREVAKNPELAQSLTLDHLCRISEQQDRGFTLFDARTEGILDQLDAMFDKLDDWFTASSGKLDELCRRFDEHEEVMAKLGTFLDRNSVSTSTSNPTKVTVGSEEELQQLRAIRDQLRSLPPELLSAADWTHLGDALRAAGLFKDALRSDEAAATAAKATADRAAEAEAEYKRYKDACETEEWDKAAAALRCAVDLDQKTYEPFDWNRYHLVGVLGTGGFGTVFHCLDKVEPDDNGTPTPVAIKTLHHDGLDRPVDVVFREARTLGKITHPHIIKSRHQAYAFMPDSRPESWRRPYFVLDYFPGQTLEAYLKEHKTVPAGDLIQIAWQVAGALHAAHADEVLHRDMKPANILVVRRADGSWDTRVIDFGLAVKVSAATRASMNIPSDRRTSQDRNFAGTLRYAAPEQKGDLPGVPVGPHTDVYAFGRTCIECLLGHTEGQDEEWEDLPEPPRSRLKKLLNGCVRRQLDGKFPRHTGFEPIITELSAMIGGGLPPPPGPSVRIESLHPQPLTISVGGMAGVVVRVVRNHFDGPLAVTAENLPPSLTSQASPIPVGATEARVQVTAGQNAVPGTATARIVVRGGELTDAGSLNVHVTSPPPPPQTDVWPTRGTEGLPGVIEGPPKRGEGSWLVYLPPKVVQGRSRWVHFSWTNGGDSYRIRDFINPEVPHGRPNPTAEAIWKAARGGIKCRKERGLFVSATKSETKRFWQLELARLNRTVCVAQAVQHHLGERFRAHLYLPPELRRCADLETAEGVIAVVDLSNPDPLSAPPLLVMELVNPAITEYINSKVEEQDVARYAGGGVGEYWRVNLAQLRVDQFRNADGFEYGERTSVDLTSPLTLSGIPGVSIPLREILERCK